MVVVKVDLILLNTASRMMILETRLLILAEGNVHGLTSRFGRGKSSNTCWVVLNVVNRHFGGGVDVQ